MIYRGRVESGKVVFDSPPPIPEGAEVVVRYESSPTESRVDSDDPFLQMLELAGPTGIPDLATNHDHYLYGHPKVEDEQ